MKGVIIAAALGLLAVILSAQSPLYSPTRTNLPCPPYCKGDGGIAVVNSQAILIQQENQTDVTCDATHVGEIRRRANFAFGTAQHYICNGSDWQQLVRRLLVPFSIRRVSGPLNTGDIAGIAPPPIGTEGHVLVCTGFITTAGSCTGACVPPSSGAMDILQLELDGGSTRLCTFPVSCTAPNNTVLVPMFCPPNTFRPYPDVSGQIIMTYDGGCTQLPEVVGNCLVDTGLHVLPGP